MRIAVLTHVAGRLTIRSKQMILVQLIMAVAIIAAVIVYFLRRRISARPPRFGRLRASNARSVIVVGSGTMATRPERDRA